MLFDLRSRGRRRMVQVIYLGLAVLIGGGLVLFGVGTGSGGGGLLNGIGNTGSGGGGSVASAQESQAIKQIRKDPKNPTAWSNLIEARWENANSSGFNSSTSTYTASGKKELAGLTSAWQSYSKLTSSPSATTATLAARSYEALGQYAQAASAWQAQINADPGPAGYECLAENAYAAKESRLGGLATAKVLAMEPKSTRTQIQTQINAAKTTPSTAQHC